MQTYTISIFTEDKIGLLHRVTIIFTRRHLNIESLTVSETEIHGISRYTVTIKTTAEMAEKVAKQLEKQVEVLKAFCHTDEEVVWQEIALYKIASQVFQGQAMNIERVVRQHHARILHLNADFLVIEKTGHQSETQELFDHLSEYGEILEFVRSGRVAITKPMKLLSAYLKEIEQINEFSSLYS